MKKIKVLIMFLVIIFISSKILFIFGPNILGGGKLSYKVMREFSEEMKIDKGLSICEIGGGEYNGTWLFTVGFDRRALPINQEEARQLIVECTEKLISKVNQNKELIPYLRDFPISENNIDLVIYCNQQDGNSYKDPHIGACGCHEGRLAYKINDLNKPHKYKSVVRESYKEALTILNKQKEISQ